MSEPSAAVRVERRGGVGDLVLCRPDRRNALDYAAVGEILDALRTLDDDPDVGSVLVYGEGRRSAPAEISPSSNGDCRRPPTTFTAPARCGPS